MCWFYLCLFVFQTSLWTVHWDWRLFYVCQGHTDRVHMSSGLYQHCTGSSKQLAIDFQTSLSVSFSCCLVQYLYSSYLAASIHMQIAPTEVSTQLHLASQQQLWPSRVSFFSKLFHINGGVISRSLFVSKSARNWTSVWRSTLTLNWEQTTHQMVCLSVFSSIRS